MKKIFIIVSVLASVYAFGQQEERFHADGFVDGGILDNSGFSGGGAVGLITDFYMNFKLSSAYFGEVDGGFMDLMLSPLLHVGPRAVKFTAGPRFGLAYRRKDSDDRFATFANIGAEAGIFVEVNRGLYKSYVVGIETNYTNRQDPVARGLEPFNEFRTRLIVRMTF